MKNKHNLTHSVFYASFHFTRHYKPL